MPRTQSSQSIDNNNERMVEQALFDIYLCDNCEAELYSLEAYTVCTTIVNNFSEIDFLLFKYQYFIW